MCYGPYKSAQLLNEENFVATFEYEISGVRKIEKFCVPSFGHQKRMLAWQ